MTALLVSTYAPTLPPVPEHACPAAGSEYGPTVAPGPISAPVAWLRTTVAPGADDAVAQRGVRTDGRPRGDPGRPEQLRARQQGHVGGQLDAGVDPGGLRVDDGDAGAHPALDEAVPQRPAQGSQLDPVVDALGLGGVVDGDGVHAAARRARHGRRRRSGRPRRPRCRCPAGPSASARNAAVERVDAGVDLGDGGLLGRRVPLLDDRDDRAVVVAQHAAVPGRVGAAAAVSTVTASPRLLVQRDEVAQRRRCQQRDVAVA